MKPNLEKLDGLTDNQLKSISDNVDKLSIRKAAAQATQELDRDIDKSTVQRFVARGSAKEFLDDPDAWSQEYLCEFMGSSSVMFPYDLIVPCESESATESPSFDLNPALKRNPNLYAGIDFGRKNHLTVCWILESIPNQNPDLNHYSVWKSAFRDPQSAIVCYPRSPNAQKHVHSRPTRNPPRASNVAAKFASITPALASVSATTSPRNSPAAFPLRTSWGERQGEVPRWNSANSPMRLNPSFSRASELHSNSASSASPSAARFREDLHAIQRTVTQSGQITYRAPQTADGHSDRTTALALALRAASSAPISCPATTLFVPGRSADLRWARRAPGLLMGRGLF